MVVSVAFSCGRAIVFSPRGALGLDTLSTSPLIESWTFLFQELLRTRWRFPTRPRVILHTRAAQPPRLARPSSCGCLSVGFGLYRGSYLRLSLLLAIDPSRLVAPPFCSAPRVSYGLISYSSISRATASRKSAHSSCSGGPAASCPFVWSASTCARASIRSRR